jgi:alanine racemase
MTRHRETRAVVHLANLEWNCKALTSLLPSKDTFFCPMVKANGYGHGDILVAKKLAELGARHLGVGLIEEGILLREAGIKTEIVFYGLSGSSGVDEIVQFKLTPVLSDWSQLEAFEKRAPEAYPVHLKFDTGMHRLGFAVHDKDRLLDHFTHHSRLKLKGVLTHLHSGEDAHQIEGQSFRQLQKFQQIAKSFSEFEVDYHALNSASFLNLAQNKLIRESPEIPKNLGVRPGLALYGLSPIPECQVQLKPVMSLRSKIVKTHKIKKGDGVSYNQTWRAQRDSTIGVIPIGYADGYHRLLSNKAQVLLGDLLIPQIGNVCMDYIMVDLTEALNSHSIEFVMENEITLFGFSQNNKLLSVTDLANWAGTIAWEILTSVGVRVPREVEA